MVTTDTNIQSRILRTEKIDWKDLQFIQNDDFKQWIDGADKKLIHSILKYQFIDPFKVWEHDGKLFCLDGKHRWLDLKAIADQGFNVPDKLDATFIDCKDITEAAELVLVYSSNYARITSAGLLSFVSTYAIDLPEIDDIICLHVPDPTIIDTLEYPDELIAEPKDKPASVKITFATPKDLEKATQKIEALISEFPGSFFSVSCGEI